jgi:pimeloyl-ACP methyl ester carboxylesterase
LNPARPFGIVLIALSLACLTAGGLLADDPVSETFTAKGVKIHYVIDGKGEPVILVHGLLSSGWINWQLPGVFADLAKDHRVIAIDLPGHGRSDRPAKKEAYGVQMVDDIALLLDVLKIKKAHIVGYSLGGMVTVKFMARHPDRVLSGTVCGMGWFEDGSGLQKFWEFIGKKGTDKGFGPPPAFIETVGQLAVTEAELKKIDAPVKVLIGSQDICKQLYVEPLQKVRKDWPVAEIDNAGHFDCILKKQFREEVGAWVRKNIK